MGAGPAGFYAAMHLTKKLESVNIDILEKLPVPFGLIRWVTVNFRKFIVGFFKKKMFIIYFYILSGMVWLQIIQK